MSGKSKPTPQLLSGGNPRVEKGDGDGPVREYLQLMPGWKREVGLRFDEVVSQVLPDAKRAVRWNSPFYGVQGRGWFASMHCFTKYVKATFFDGVELVPQPPISGKDPRARFVHFYEDTDFDVCAVTQWVSQAARLPGWDGFK